MLQKIIRDRRPLQQIAFSIIIFTAILFACNGHANGIYRNGIGGRAMSLGGADVAWAEDALGAMAANPAGLGFLKEPTLDLGFVAATASGRFSKSPNLGGKLDSSPGFAPEAAFAMPLGDSPISLGLAFVPDALLSADWTYTDPPGGLGGTTSYGRRRHKSEIIILRSSLGAGIRFNDKLSFGANLGLIYNQNTLQAPYIFQTQPALRGAKTLLDLNTSGYGWNALAGFLFRPCDEVQFGLSYKSETRVHSRGDASGDAGAQFGVASLPFHYDAEVVNTFPQMISGGVSWKAHSRLRFIGQVDWINWGDAFDNLPVKLRHGSSAAVNSVAGSTALNDSVPLDWKDRFVYRAGLEFALCENLFLRGGYSYGKSPVPDKTLTPLTAAISEHTVTAGVGFERGQYAVDFGYQWDLPASQEVKQSKLRSGEYNNSRVEVGVHWLALTASRKF